MYKYSQQDVSEYSDTTLSIDRMDSFVSRKPMESSFMMWAENSHSNDDFVRAKSNTVNLKQSIYNLNISGSKGT